MGRRAGWNMVRSTGATSYTYLATVYIRARPHQAYQASPGQAFCTACWEHCVSYIIGRFAQAWKEPVTRLRRGSRLTG
jgi:hypothetical protein